MKTDVSFSDFVDRFRVMDRFNHFEYDGMRALYDCMIQYEEDAEEEVELDVIALCCEYKRYEDLQEFLGEYGDDWGNKTGERQEYNGIERKDYETEEEFEEAVKEKITDYTQVIEIDGSEAFIIFVY